VTGNTNRIRKKEPRGSFFYGRAGGFTIAELLAVLVIVGVIAAVAAPRLGLVGTSFDEAKLHDQTLAALRFAQKSAVAMQRTVCVAFTGGTTLTLTYAGTYGSTSCPGSPLPPPGGGTGAASYTVVRQGTAAYTSATDFHFDRVGRPSAAQTLTMSGGKDIVIEAETGYVR
jgi:MSHA pilin protein MshC